MKGKLKYINAMILINCGIEERKENESANNSQMKLESSL